MRYQDFLLSAVNNTLRGTVALQNPSIDAVGIADTLFPVVSQAVCEAIAADEYRRPLLLRQQTLVFAAGIAAIPTDVLQNYLWDSTLIDAAVLTRHYAYRDYPDFVRRGDQRLGVYSIRGEDTLVLCDPQVAFTVPLTSSGTRILNTPSVVEKPALATDQIDCPLQVISDLDEALSTALRAQLTIKEAGQAA